MKKIISTFIMVFIITNLTSFAYESHFDEGELSFELLDRHSGLSNLSVSGLIQDKYGYIWIATQGGLNRYDGHEITEYRNDPFSENGLIHNLIQTIFYDEEEHELWLGTYNGVSKLNIDTDTFTNYYPEDGFSDSVITGIEKDQYGNMWFGSLSGLTKMTPSGEFEIYTFEGLVVRTLLESQKGVLFAGTYSGLYRYDLESNLFSKEPINMTSETIMIIKEFDKDIITIGTWLGGIVNYNYQTGQYTITRLSDERIYNMYMTDDEFLWIGTWGGGLIGLRDSVELEHYDSKNTPISHDIIYSFLQDHSGILWIGTNGGGLYKSNPRKRNHVIYEYDESLKNSISSGAINVIFEDNHQQLWVSVYGKGLHVLKKGSKEFYQYSYTETDSNLLVDTLIRDIKQLNDDELIMATGKGLYKVNVNTFDMTHLPLIPDDPILYAAGVEKEGHYWVGTYGQGVYHYDDKVLTLYSEVDNSLSNDLVYDILVDTKDRVWIATNDGLNMKESAEDSFVVFRRRQGDKTTLANNSIQIIYEDSNEIIWIGTDGGGLAMYNEDGTFTSITEEDGLSSNSVVGLLEDDENRLIISTGEGITSYDMVTSIVVKFTPDDGIGGWEFTSGHTKLADGSLLFGGKHGITKFPSYINETSKHVPRIYITDVMMNQTPLQKTTQHYNQTAYEFASSENHFSFEFVALDYDNSESIRYNYKLKGFDEKWIKTDSQIIARYANLPPGDYVFQVYAETLRRSVSDIANITFTIKPPWYFTYYALIGYLICFVVVVLIIIKFREFSVVGKKNVELAEVNKKLAIANDNLIEISIMDSLTSIYNRRYFDRELTEKLSLAKRSSTYITLIMIDLDDFKNINDKYGHIAGDYLLSDIAKAFNQMMPRKTDFVARYGGDEFAVVLYDTDLEGSKVVADKLLEISNKVHIPLAISRKIISARVSIGISCIIPKDDLEIETLINSADEALYAAKDKGGQQYVVSNFS